MPLRPTHADIEPVRGHLCSQQPTSKLSVRTVPSDFLKHTDSKCGADEPPSRHYHTNSTPHFSPWCRVCLACRFQLPHSTHTHKQDEEGRGSPVWCQTNKLPLSYRAVEEEPHSGGVTEWKPQQQTEVWKWKWKVGLTPGLWGRSGWLMKFQCSHCDQRLLIDWLP